MRILTHNTYWFQGSPSRWGKERVAEVPEVMNALIDLYSSFLVDILCLQEVHNRAVAEKIANALEMPTWLYVLGGKHPEYGGVAISKFSNAILSDMTRSNGKEFHERIHIRINIPEKGNQFVVASVHLPSNRFVTSEEEGDNARIDELKRILFNPYRPDLIVGDMNCKPNSLPYKFMKESDYVDVAEVTDCANLNYRRIDYMWLDKKFEKRILSFSVINNNSFIQKTAEGEIWKLSDHFPLLMEIK